MVLHHDIYLHLLATRVDNCNFVSRMQRPDLRCSLRYAFRLMKRLFASRDKAIQCMWAKSLLCFRTFESIATPQNHKCALPFSGASSSNQNLFFAATMQSPSTLTIRSDQLSQTFIAHGGTDPITAPAQITPNADKNPQQPQLTSQHVPP